jgi:hypothetical protein
MVQYPATSGGTGKYFLPFLSLDTTMKIVVFGFFYHSPPIFSTTAIFTLDLAGKAPPWNLGGVAYDRHHPHRSTHRQPLRP